MRRPVTAAAQVGATTTTNLGTGGSGGSRKRSSKKRKKPVPSASYYDPAFTWPQFPGAPPQYTPGGVVVPEVVAGVEVGPKTATVTAVTSKSGDIVYPKIDVNSIFF